jgi:hypothetical protein
VRHDDGRCHGPGGRAHREDALVGAGLAPGRELEAEPPEGRRRPDLGEGDGDDGGDEDADGHRRGEGARRRPQADAPGREEGAGPEREPGCRADLVARAREANLEGHDEHRVDRDEDRDHDPGGGRVLRDPQWQCDLDEPVLEPEEGGEPGQREVAHVAERPGPRNRSQAPGHRRVVPSCPERRGEAQGGERRDGIQGGGPEHHRAVRVRRVPHECHSCRPGSERHPEVDQHPHDRSRPHSLGSCEGAGKYGAAGGVAREVRCRDAGCEQGERPHRPHERVRGEPEALDAEEHGHERTGWDPVREASSGVRAGDAGRARHGQSHADLALREVEDAGEVEQSEGEQGAVPDRPGQRGHPEDTEDVVLAVRAAALGASWVVLMCRHDVPCLASRRSAPA